MKHLWIALTVVCLSLGSAVTPAHAQSTSRPPNAALRYWQAFALMRDPASDKATTDLIENVAAGKSPWDEARLGPILDANEDALQTLQRGTKLADCDWGIDYELGPTAPIAHLAKARVLGRLNALAGMRLASRGRLPEAVITWLAGVTFAEHVARGGSLISLLSARPVLVANLTAMSEPLRRPVGETTRKQVATALTALPETGFDWGAALQREQGALEVAVQQLASASDYKSAYATMMGQPAPGNSSLPTAADITAFRVFMGRAVEALRLPPSTAGPRIATVEATRSTLHPFFAGRIPLLSRINTSRAELKAQRDAVLAVVGR